MIRLPANLGCRLSWLLLAVFVLAVPLLAPMPADGQPAPDARPDSLPFIYDADGIYSDDQMATLRRDAELLQSTGIPTLVYARAVTAAEAGRNESQAFADQVRRDWNVASAPGAEDGLVLLFSWVPQNPLASTTVFSYGKDTFTGSGLSPESIQASIDTSVRSLADQERPFEALVYLMRETRYAGIYAPPLPPAREGGADVAYATLRWAGPALAAGTITALAALTRSFWVTKPPQRRIWSVVGIVLGAAALLWALSVYGQSRVGIASSLAMIAAVAVAAWTWSRLGFARHGSRSVRRRAVPATSTLMRRRQQARAMFARQAGGTR